MNCADTASLGPAELFPRLAGFVRRVLGHQGIPESEVDDLTQDVFVILHRKGHRFEHDRAARAWLGEAARKVASNRRRASRRAQQRSPLWEPASPPAADEVVMRRDAASAVRRFAAQLPDNARAVFELSEVEGRPAPEVARRLGLGLNTTYSHIRRVRRRWARAVALGLGAVALLVSMFGTCAAEASDDGRNPVRLAALDDR